MGPAGSMENEAELAIRMGNDERVGRPESGRVGS